MTKRILVTMSVLLFGCAPAGPGELDLDAGGETGVERFDAWPAAPLDMPDDCEARALGAIACPCELDTECVDGLACRSGFCGPCPAGQIGCACEAGDVCDVEWMCVGGLCV